MTSELTDQQKQLLAHALFQHVAIHGEIYVYQVVEVVEQLGIMKEYATLAHRSVQAFEKKMLAHNKTKDEDSKPQNI